MKELFNPENPIFRFFCNVADLIFVNMLMILCSLPLVTIGAAFAAGHKLCQNIIFDEGGGVVAPFFRAFKENFKQATITWLVSLLVLAGLGVNVYFLFVFYTGAARTLLLILFAFFAALTVGISGLMFPLMVRYENRLREHFRNALLLFVQKLPKAVLVIVMNLLPVLLTVFMPAFSVQAAPFWVMIGFALTVLLETLLLKSTFLQLEARRDELHEDE